MQKPRWLDSYSGESAEELIALESEYGIVSLILAFEQAVDQKAEREGSDSLSDVEKIILAVEALEREVNNGGFSQFFINSSREYAPMIVEALLRIGCKETAALAREAVEALHLPSLTDQAINAAMQEDDEVRDKELSRIDRLYFDGNEPIAQRLFDFIKANRAAVKI